VKFKDIWKRLGQARSFKKLICMYVDAAVLLKNRSKNERSGPKRGVENYNMKFNGIPA
jgi:hypothetical protein